VIAVTLQPADQGDTTTIRETLAEAGETVAHLIEREVEQAPKEEPKVNLQGIEEVVADKGYHSGSAVQAIVEAPARTYIRSRSGSHASGRARLRRKRRSTTIDGGSRQLRQAALEEARRADRAVLCALLRNRRDAAAASARRENVLKRQLIHVGAFNLSLICGGTWARERRVSSTTTKRGSFSRFCVSVPPWK